MQFQRGYFPVGPQKGASYREQFAIWSLLLILMRSYSIKNSIWLSLLSEIHTSRSLSFRLGQRVYAENRSRQKVTNAYGPSDGSRLHNYQSFIIVFIVERLVDNCKTLNHTCVNLIYETIAIDCSRGLWSLCLKEESKKPNLTFLS